RVLNASVAGVTFRLPLFGVDACKRAACRARGGAADVWSELLQALLDPGKELLRLCWVFWRFGEVLDALSTRGRREEWGKHRAMLGLRVLREVGSPRFCVSQAPECARGLSRCSGTVEVLSSSWTPSLSGRVVVRLRERRQWDNDLAAVGLYVRNCETERLFLCCVVRRALVVVSPVVVCHGVGTVVVVVGVEVELCSVGVVCEACSLGNALPVWLTA
ncbi:hypothetical protein Taro_029257, partial [Colocasia esculenta]|nr:hypothetical protein [Colocasia esculenta]